MKTITSIIFSFFFICSTAYAYDYIPLVKETPKTFEIGSAIQWNKDYIVTAKHATFLENIAYKCPNSCDIMFVKMEAKSSIPEWRNHIPNENVTIVGNSSEQKTIIAKGKDMNLATNTNTNMDIDVYMTTASTQGGMSGGPVFGDDGKVIGMLVSTVEVKKQPDDLKKISNNQPISIFIPYLEIQKQWDIFQKNM